MARSHNHCSSGNATVRSVCIVELHVTVSAILKYVLLHKDAFWRVYVATNNKTYLGLRVNFLIFFVRFWPNMEFHERFSWKFPTSNFTGNPSNDSRASTCRQTDGHDEGNMQNIQNVTCNVQLILAKIYRWHKRWNTVLLYWSLLLSVFCMMCSSLRKI